MYKPKIDDLKDISASLVWHIRHGAGRLGRALTWKPPVLHKSNPHSVSWMFNIVMLNVAERGGDHPVCISLTPANIIAFAKQPDQPAWASVQPDASRAWRRVRRHLRKYDDSTDARVVAHGYIRELKITAVGAYRIDVEVSAGGPLPTAEEP